jgi:hypothetical protein
LGEVLALNEDTLLNGEDLTLRAYKDTGQYDPKVPPHQKISVEMFKGNPGKYWDDLHLLPKGTRLRCVKLGRFFGNEGRHYLLSVEILDGEFKGKVVYVGPVAGDPKQIGTLQLIPSSLVHPVED